MRAPPVVRMSVARAKWQWWRGAAGPVSGSSAVVAAAAAAGPVTSRAAGPSVVAAARRQVSLGGGGAGEEPQRQRGTARAATAKASSTPINQVKCPGPWRPRHPGAWPLRPRT